MFGKLLKYEFKSIGKWYFAINLAIIAIAGLLSVTIKWLEIGSKPQSATMSLLNQLLPLALSLIFGSLITGSLLATLLIIINRFNKNIFGREGYLTMTLPVSEHQLILSKLISSLVWGFFNGLILILATLIMVIPQVSSREINGVIKNVSDIIMKNPSTSVQIAVYYLLSAIGSVLLIYLAISIGQLFANRRGLKAFIAYFIITITVSILLAFINFQIFDIKTTNSNLIFSQRFYLIGIVETLIETIIFYLATYGIIKYKLNLQ
ncbi:MAG: ABC transporter permease [Streptococcus parauberis]